MSGGPLTFLGGAGLGLLLCLATPAAPASQSAELDAAAARITAASQALAAATAPEGRLVALDTAITAYQSALDLLRSVVAGASTRERELTLALDSRREELQHLIAALETMSRTPPPAQALHPLGPVGAARAAAMLSRLTPELQAQATEMAQEYADVAAARALRQEGERDLAAGIAALGAARTELGETLARNAPPQPRGTEDPALAMMVRDSDTLTTLAAKIALTAAPSGVAPGAGKIPDLARPVKGEIVRGYQQPDAAGVKRPGIVIQAPPLSLVTAPADAIVRYAGPFLDYGYVVVLEADDETLVVLAGLAQLQVSTGDAVRNGALLGLLGGPAFEAQEAPGAQDPDAAEDVNGGSGADEMLYIEVRHGQGPVDPATLFTGENG
ncbi:MAG: peptidoglycan DD-metalloendopeptidase family protein [Amaricoccus sp.]